MHREPLQRYPAENDLMGRWFPGCNWWSGYVHLQPNGAFTTSHDCTTLKHCGSEWDRSAFTMVTAVTRAVRLTITDDVLAFHDVDDGTLGTFERAPSQAKGRH